MNKLIKLKGKEISFTINYKKAGDFIFHEAPLFSHLISDKNENYLIKWCDVSDEYHRWMLFETNETLLLAFFEKKISLPELIKSACDDYVYFIETGAGAKWERVTKVSAKDIPTEYLPLPDAFYNKPSYERYAHLLHTQLFDKIGSTAKPYPTATHEPEMFVAREEQPKKYGKKDKG